MVCRALSRVLCWRCMSLPETRLSFFHSFNRHLLRSSDVPGTGLGVGNTSFHTGLSLKACFHLYVEFSIPEEGIRGSFLKGSP